MNKTMLAIASLATALTAAAPASAQQWGVQVRSGWGNPGYQGYAGNYRGGYDRGGYDNDDARDICSGQRAHALEARIGHELDEGDIDRGTARYLHQMVDRTEDQQRYACRSGDRWRLREIDRRYDEIGHRIGHEEREGRRGW
ncbi:hypothetical protein [Novosphingobium lentum]|uniref:hypothetical protein n=1 Tax=Novosphingobium lentum TaxID=145287 RepID=UPI000836745F|nr:hypothetical protein [Novosphingobium lentum]